MRIIAFFPLALLIVFTVGVGVLPSTVGTIAMLALLIVTGLAWRIVKLLVGGLMMFASQL